MKLTLEKVLNIMKINKGNLNLNWSDVESLPDNLFVPGNLYMYNCSIKDLPRGLIVGGDLNISKTLVERLPDDLVIGGNLDVSNTPLKEVCSGLIVPGYFDLSSTPIKVLPDNLIVGGAAFLQKTKVTKLSKGMVVGDCIDLRNTLVTELPDDLVVNGRIYADNIKAHNPNTKCLRNGDYVEGRYLYANGALTQVEYCYKEQECTVYVGKVKGRNVVSDGKYYVQCSDIKAGIAEIKSKTLNALDIVQYKSLTLDSVVELREAITMYCDITGARIQETNKFVASIKNLKGRYVVREIIMLTKGQYGHNQFVDFFKNSK